MDAIKVVDNLVVTDADRFTVTDFDGEILAEQHPA